MDCCFPLTSVVAVSASCRLMVSPCKLVVLNKVKGRLYRSLLLLELLWSEELIRCRILIIRLCRTRREVSTTLNGVPCREEAGEHGIRLDCMVSCCGQLHIHLDIAAIFVELYAPHSIS